MCLCTMEKINKQRAKEPKTTKQKRLKRPEEVKRFYQQITGQTVKKN